MEQVVQVDLPVHLGVERERQVDAGEFAGDAVLEQALVGSVDVGLLRGQAVDDRAPEVRRNLVVGAPLLVALRLEAHLVRLRDVEFVLHHRVASRDLVEAGGAVPDPLARDEDRHLDVEREDDLLEGARVLVAHQVVDERAVLADRLRPLAVRHPGGLHDACIASEVVDEAHEALVEDGDGLVEHGVGFWDPDASHGRHHSPEGGFAGPMHARCTTPRRRRL